MPTTVDVDPSCPSRGVHADLGWALTTVLRAYVRAADAAVADLPGASRGYRLLSAIVQDCPRSQLALAHHVGLDRTVVTYLVDDLVAAGLVQRRADPNDRRTWRVVATDAGTAHLDQLDCRLSEVEREVLRPLGGAEAAQLRTLLQRMAVVVADAESSPTTCSEVAVLGAPDPGQVRAGSGLPSSAVASGSAPASAG